jgi:hypothetical protein
MITRNIVNLQNEELHDLYSSPNIVRVIKYRTRRAGHVGRMGRGEACTGLWWGNLRERDNWGNPGGDWKIILRWIFSRRDVKYGLDLACAG